ncbi:PIN domain-containing protein [Lactobacillaceae bacterium 24-114]
MRTRIIKLIYVIVGAAIGFYYLPLLWNIIDFHMGSALLFFFDIFVGAFVFFLLSLLLAKPTEQLVTRIEKSLMKLSPVYLFFGTLLTIIGLALAVLISIPLWRTGIPVINNVLPILLMVTFSYFGYRIGTTRLNDWKNFFPHRGHDKDDNAEVISQKDENYHHYKILDTNILIDGRIYDLVKTGFLEGTLLVPNFVLYELQYIADSGESIKRVRGRRGLDILNKLRKEKIIPIEMYDGDFEDIPEVDSKLIALAKKVNGVIVTNDYNLNKVIQFQNVQVLNINNLAKSLRARVIPGEKLNVEVVKKGTERQQGVAYLDDGTMVVVEDGRYFMNQRIDVEVTSALQTDAGRMIFARPLHSNKGIDEKSSNSSDQENKGKDDQEK